MVTTMPQNTLGINVGKTSYIIVNTLNLKYNGNTAQNIFSARFKLRSRTIVLFKRNVKTTKILIFMSSCLLHKITKILVIFSVTTKF